MVCSSCVVPEDMANTGTAGYVSLGSAGAATLFLGGEDDFYAAMPAAFAFVAALMSWPSCFAVDGWVLEPHVLLPLFFGMVALALPSLGSAL